VTLNPDEQEIRKQFIPALPHSCKIMAHRIKSHTYTKIHLKILQTMRNLRSLNSTASTTIAYQSRLRVCGDDKLLVIGVILVKKICTENKIMRISQERASNIGKKTSTSHFSEIDSNLILQLAPRCTRTLPSPLSLNRPPRNHRNTYYMVINFYLDTWTATVNRKV
jgi:hypothetical protein